MGHCAVAQVDVRSKLDKLLQPGSSHVTFHVDASEAEPSPGMDSAPVSREMSATSLRDRPMSLLSRASSNADELSEFADDNLVSHVRRTCRPTQIPASSSAAGLRRPLFQRLSLAKSKCT